METIGVRELKSRASEILRRVREDGDAFEVTYHGRAIARIVPVCQPKSETPLSAFWDRWDELSRAIGAAWPSGVSAVDAVRAGRRELWWSWTPASG